MKPTAATAADCCPALVLVSSLSDPTQAASFAPHSFLNTNQRIANRSPIASLAHFACGGLCAEDELGRPRKR